MAQAMLEEHGAQPPQQDYFEMVKEVIGVAYLAGTDTTGTPVLSFFLAMLLNPDVQKKAQAEVDRIVGADRLPEIEDRKDMPYIEALVNELFRWLPVLPMGKPFLFA
jgi:cytochrome P450